MPSRVIPWMGSPPFAGGLYVLTTERTNQAGEVEVKAGRAFNIARRLATHGSEIRHRFVDRGIVSRCTLIAVGLVESVAIQKRAERDLLRAIRSVGRRVEPPDWYNVREWFWLQPERLLAIIRGGF